MQTENITHAVEAATMVDLTLYIPTDIMTPGRSQYDAVASMDALRQQIAAALPQYTLDIGINPDGGPIGIADDGALSDEAKAAIRATVIQVRDAGEWYVEPQVATHITAPITVQMSEHHTYTDHRMERTDGINRAASSANLVEQVSRALAAAGITAVVTMHEGDEYTYIQPREALTDVQWGAIDDVIADVYESMDWIVYEQR